MTAQLTGLRILVPRGGDAAVRAEDAIRTRGGVPVRVPLIATVPPVDPAAFDAAIAAWNAGEYEWLAVTSAAGAAAVAAAGASPGRIAAVGPATVAALAAGGLAATVRPVSEFTGTALGAALAAELGTASDTVPDQPTRILLALAEGAGTELERALQDAGHLVTRVTAYRTVPAPRDPARERTVATGHVDVILVTSGSVAREVAVRFLPLPAGVRLVAIGPPTARVLAELGLTPDLVAERHTVPGMLDALAAAHPHSFPPHHTGESA
ncbi:Uroporphyrinogen-III synthase [Leucobacter sp. 7(1)]|uniref:uroporphyrinogen-III synthase n=1 Tax=Leucobacter sp. 7(1) TaxID=1255613 RepID=UPI00097F461C|nr:uroporphyrinogen-III synthase [Leucobacter sp. 7(1)]SJN11516.1 Uroporphyrinogen-III synthase [Leucobacter sp. 7(1)]